MKLDAPNSENYYNDVRNFTREVLSEASKSLAEIAAGYMNYISKFGLEKTRATEEYILELLSFGVLWRSYSKTALSVKIAPFITLAKMAEWRKKHAGIKPYIDFIRGILLTLFLIRNRSNKYEPPIPTLSQIDHVCKWFEATGEFREQALRFIRWRAFWGTKNPEELSSIFYSIEQFTSWFETKSIERIGKYTENIENFLKDETKNYRWREDRISCSRKRIEYHLNMVGAELLNIAYSDDFVNTDKKVVLVPGCMRGKSVEDCEAVPVKEGLRCRGCFSKCRVNQLREMGKKYSFDVYIIPHASDLSLWSPVTGRPKRGVIASACVPTLVEGGWELKRYDVPAQCVLLDYSGCQKHWNCRGITTGFNLKELRRILS